MRELNSMSGFDFIVRSFEDLTDAVERFGIVPLFKNSIPGFSVEEHVVPEVWFSDGEGVWEWKGPVIRQTGCAYGKLFEKKAAFVSAELYRELANCRRDGYDFDARYEDGLAQRRDMELYDLVEKNAPVLSRSLKAMGDYRKGGRTDFDTSMNRLQEQCYIIISDFVYSRDRYGTAYGWGIAEYTTPEQFYGKSFTEHVYNRSPAESRGLILDRLRALLPHAEESVLEKFLK